MNGAQSHQLSQRDIACSVFARSLWTCRFPLWASFAIAVGGLVAYWGIGFIAACLERDFLPAALWLFLYFAHYSALGGLVASAFSMRMEKESHLVLWGAIAGAIVAALLMT